MCLTLAERHASLGQSTDLDVPLSRLLDGIRIFHNCAFGFSVCVPVAERDTIDTHVLPVDGIPVSTTMCITGSTAGVGLVSGGCECSSDVRGLLFLLTNIDKAINWRAFGWIFLGWVLTVPVAALAGGILMGIILNAPHF